MWKIVETGQFKKDLKRYQHQTDKLLALSSVLQSLRDSGTVPASNKPHRLAGKWNGYMECHIQSDFLLIWLNAESQEIRVVRLGTHAELFGR